MSQSDFLTRIVDRLNAAGIPFMVAGSLSSSFHGESRATNDLDLVISPTSEQLGTFLKSLGEDFYVSEQSANEALQHRSMFNVIDFTTGWKADLIIRKERPFSVAEFARRQPATVMDVAVFVASAEDTILSKLEWAKMSASDRQIKDALGVARLQFERLDVEYLRQWATQLGVLDTLDELLAAARQSQ